MKTMIQLFRETWEKKKLRGWEYVYILVDLHGVIIPPGCHNHDNLQFVSAYAEESLQYLSNQKDVKLILWTSSFKDEVDKVLQWLEKRNIYFDFVNENPMEKNNEYADFSKKFYTNIILDDKSGFETDDWFVIWHWIHYTHQNNSESV
jgi:hypothetical protein